MASAERLIEIFNDAKARPSGLKRDRLLAESCGDDEPLKAQVLSLLRAHESAGEFLKPAPLSTEVEAELARLKPEEAGERISHYKLLEQIGQGGFGTVWVAEQERPVRRRVALKIIKLGMDTREVIARFEQERQALAMMDHPNIAKVFDAGATETGRPYFVMELVRGVKITEYCDQSNLSTAARLQLFIAVCQAVQHAHQKGIIHRDLKPSNILVTMHDGVPVPKVIDFGVAKATQQQRLTELTVYTQFQQMIGTPLYMSPEQAEMSGLDIDTRSDIYSLGVLLYELLTGRTPFDPEVLMRQGLDEIRRTIREQEPQKPSTFIETMAGELRTGMAQHRQADAAKLVGLIRGDLDWIVMKAIEKDRARRYETASAFGMDIQRHLDNEPVLARPATALYRFRRLIRRNKLVFAASSAVAIALVLGVMVSSWQAIRATRAEREQSRLRETAQGAQANEAELRRQAEAGEKKARTEATKSQQVAQFLKEMLKSVGPSVALGRDTKMLREILDKTAERITEDLKDQPDVEAELRSTIGTVYWELGDFDKSAAMYRQVLAIQRKRQGDEHLSVARSLITLGEALRHQRKLTEAEAAFRESLATRRKLLGSEHEAVVESLNHLGSLLSIELQNDEPEALLREALAIGRRLFANDHRYVATSLDDLGHILNRNGKAKEAEAMHYEALEIRKRIWGNTHPELLYSFINLAEVLESQGKLADAEAMIRAALALSQKLLGQQHPEFPRLRSELARIVRAQGKPEGAERPSKSDTAQSPGSVASVTPIELSSNENSAAAGALQDQAALLIGQGKPLDAEPLFRQAAALLKRLVEKNPERDTLHLALGHAQWKLGQLLSNLGRHEEAETTFLESLSVFEHAAREFPANPFFRQERAFSHRHLAREVNALGRSDDAAGHYREALKLYAALAAEAPQNPQYRRDEAYTLSMLAPLLHGQGELAELETVQRKQLAKRKEQFGDVHREVELALASLAQVLQNQGKLAETEAVWREELAVERNLSGDEHPFVANSLISLSHVLSNQNKLSEAEAAVREALVIREKALGHDHPDVASALAELSVILLGQESYPEAETRSRMCLEIRERQLPNQWQTFNARSILGGSLLGQKKYVQAEPLLVSGYEGLKLREENLPAGSKHHLGTTLQRLVQLYEGTGQTDKAAEWSRKLEELNKAEANQKPTGRKP